MQNIFLFYGLCFDVLHRLYSHLEWKIRYISLHTCGAQALFSHTYLSPRIVAIVKASHGRKLTDDYTCLFDFKLYYHHHHLSHGTALCYFLKKILCVFSIRVDISFYVCIIKTVVAWNWQFKWKKKLMSFQCLWNPLRIFLKRLSGKKLKCWRKKYDNTLKSRWDYDKNGTMKIKAF